MYLLITLSLIISNISETESHPPYNNNEPITLNPKRLLPPPHNPNPNPPNPIHNNPPPNPHLHTHPPNNPKHPQNKIPLT